MADQAVPTDAQLRLAMLQTMEQMYLHSEASTNVLMTLNARVAGAEAVAEVVDENETQVEIDRSVAAQKEVISYLYEKSHQYVAGVIAGAFAAYFATLGVLAYRFSDDELRLSALLMTISLTVFFFWEVASMVYIGFHTIKGDLGAITAQPRWLRAGWPIAMFLAVATALPAIALSITVYLRGLGVLSWIAAQV